MGPQTEYVIESSRRKLFDLAEIWRYRELFYFFAWRDIKVKYKQTVLGFLWAILQPLLMMTIFTFFFGKTLQVPSQSLPYPVFVFSGLLLWNVFAGGLSGSANSMLTNAPIIKKIYFPRIIIPVSSILGSLFDFVMAFVLYVAILLYYDQPVSIEAIWMWPLATVIVFIATLGPGAFIAALNVKYRDFRYVVPFVIQILFFLTPVIYPLSVITHPLLKLIVAASPIFAAIELFRFPLTGLFAEPVLLLVSMGSGILLFVGGLLYFRFSEDVFADLA